MNRSRLRDQLTTDEDNIPHAYKDSEGWWTIGVGHLVDERKGAGLDPDVIELQLDNDIDRKEAEVLRAFAWYGDLNDVRQEVVVNMVFNLGLSNFKEFKMAIAALAQHDFDEAARQMLDSKWARQVGIRATRLSDAMRSGEWV